jgi:hypothetical protein
MSNGTVAVPTKSPLLTDRLYSILKYAAMVILPATGALYFALAGIWGLPAAEQVVGSIAAVNAFLGLVLRISTVQYEKNNPDNVHGTVGIVEYPDGVQKILFNVLKNDEELPAVGKDVMFKVIPKHMAPYDADDE